VSPAARKPTARKPAARKAAAKKPAAKKGAAKKPAAKRPAAKKAVAGRASNKPSTPAEYIEALEEPRRSEIKRLDALIRKTVPDLERYIESGMLGYGRYHYTYDSGREGDWCLIGLASRARYISLYVTATTADGRGYLAESYQDRLPKADIGKSCLRVRRAEDLEPKALRALLREAVKNATPA
jgi:hypothetical protein